MVLEVTAKDSEGNEYGDTKVYRQIGVDTDRMWRFGAWQIKEVIDMTLRPHEMRKERVVFEFPKNMGSADVSVNVFYYISGASGEKIYSVSKHLPFR